MASTTSEESMIEPSTIASGKRLDPRRWSQYSPRFASSTSFMAELPMSSPASPFERENSTVRSTPSPASPSTAMNALNRAAR
jgi:hypothetical protein